MTNEATEREVAWDPAIPFTLWTQAKLDEALNPSRVAQDRDGNPYLEGWDVIAAANHDFGFGGWKSELLSVEPGMRFQGERGQGDRRHMADLYVYTARVRVSAGGTSHEDVGTAVTATDTPEAHETAIKGASTDALKRTLRHFGAQFGNDLYDKGRTGEPPMKEAAPPKRQTVAATSPEAKECPIHHQPMSFVKGKWAHRDPEGNVCTPEVR